jgi:hypothetical protein
MKRAKILLMILCLANSAAAQGGIIRQATEDLSQVQLQAQSGDITVVSAPAHPVRAGKNSFKFQLTKGRSEFEGHGKGPIGSTRWYGWSYFFPKDWPDRVRTLIAQWHASPWKEGRNFRESGGCAGGGPYIVVGPGDKGPSASIPWNEINFVLQRKGTSTDIKCTTHTLFPDIMELRGKWVDVVMHTMWTGNENGFLKIWTRVESGKWDLKLDYNGVTWFNDEGTSPYFKMGLYAQNKYTYLYGDEYRQGNERSSFSEVAPGGGEMPSGPPSTATTFNLNLAKGWNLISLPLVPKNSGIEALLSTASGKYDAVYSYKSGQYQSYIPGESGNSLTQMESGQGYWIYMNESAQVSLSGTAAAEEIRLSSGWNLAGFNSMRAVPIESAISSIASKIEVIYGFDRNTASYKGYSPTSLNELSELKPGEAYWIYANEETIWSLKQ